MEVKLGQLPEACHLTRSYQKHRLFIGLKKPHVCTILWHFDVLFEFALHLLPSAAWDP